jgi:hypothetical protein
MEPRTVNLQENTLREPNGRWLKGQSGNSAGRPQSSRQRIANQLLADLHEVWEEHGKSILERLAKDDPAKLATIAYGLLPKDVFVRVEDQRTPGNLEPEAWAALRRVLDIIQAANIEGDPQAIFERIEAALRADNAVLIDSTHD